MGNLATYILSLGLILLAGAITFFALEIKRTRAIIPEKLEEFDFKLISEELKEARRLIPTILEELKETRKLVPPILEEFQESRRVVPKISSIVDQAHNAVETGSKEFAAYRPSISQLTSHIPELLSEIRLTREEIPKHLDRVELLINSAKTIGKESSEAVIPGLVKGIISTPFTLIGDLIFGEGHKLNETDQKLLEGAAKKVLEKDHLNLSEHWKNSGSGVRGSVTLIKIDKSKNCRTLKVEIAAKNEEKTVKEVFLCRSDKNNWEVISY